MNKKLGYVFVWPLNTRIIHWLMVFSFVAAFGTSFYAYLLNEHVAFGFVFLVIIFYRIIWGFVGPRYATFNTFKLRPSQLKFYFVEKIKNRWRKIPAGHNPASSWFTLWAMGVGMIIVISGLLLYGIADAKGLFRFLNENFTAYIIPLEIIHKYAAYLFVAWVLIHISGVMVEQFWHKTGMVWAMITGYKKTEGEDTEVSTSLTLFALLMTALAVGVYFFVISSHYNFLTLRKFTDIDYKQEHPVFYEKCGDCHKIYPPFLLPEKSWERIMDGLDNHFGDKITDANISKSAQQSIMGFLRENSAEHSTREASVKTLLSLKGATPKEITKTPYWREAHADIPLSVFKEKKIKNRSNCFACHKDIEHGNTDNINIIYKK